MVVVSTQNVISFVALFDIWLVGTTKQDCSLIMKINDKEREINTTDVTKEFYNGRPSPLKTPKRFKLLPEAPKYINVEYDYSRAKAIVVWTPGYQAKFARYFLLKLVNDKEIDGVPKRYTRYLLHGPVPKLKRKASYLFRYKCVNIAETYKLGITIWSLGIVNMTLTQKVFWITQYSEREEIFKPDTEKVREGIRKHKEQLCVCPSEISMDIFINSHILILKHDDRQRHEFEIQSVSTQRRVFKTRRFMSNPKKNFTRLSLKLNDRGLSSNLQVFKICGRPEIRTRCSVVKTRTFYGSKQKDSATDYFAFL